MRKLLLSVCIIATSTVLSIAQAPVSAIAKHTASPAPVMAWEIPVVERIGAPALASEYSLENHISASPRAVTPSAAITAPASVYPIGMAADFSRLKSGNSYLVMASAPYRTSLTWTNSTTSTYNSTRWTYPDPTDKTNPLTATTKNLKAPAYPYGQFSAPSLQVAQDGNWSTAVGAYDLIQYGGIPVAKVNGVNTVFEPCLYDYARYVDGNVSLTVYGNALAGAGEATNSTWTSQNYLGTKVKKCTGIGMIVPPSVAPYVLSYAYVHFTSSTVTPASTLQAIIYKNTNGTLTEFARGEWSPTAAITDASKWNTAVFRLHMTDCEPAPMLIDANEMLVIKFTGEMAAGENVEFGVGADLDGMDMGNSCSCYFFFERTDGTMAWLKSTTVAFSNGSAATGIFGGFDATYAWLDCASESMAFPAEGGTQSLDFDAFYDLTSAEATVISGDGLNEWFTVKADKMNEITGLTEVKITAQPLPDNIANRTGKLTVNNYGLTKTVNISQGRGSVNDIHADQVSIKATAEGISIVSTEANPIEATVCDAMGRLIASARFTAKTEIPLNARGLLIVRLSNGTTAKIIR